MKHKPLLVIVGETGSGKSALALDLAQRFNGEIISADSWTVYKRFDIGTAKPSPQDRKQVPHHLIDVADPHLGFSAAIFKNLANSVIADIQSRSKLPILAGGTGLYIDSVIFDFSFLPAGPPGEREKLNQLTSEELLAEIEAAGISLEGVDTRNKRRLIRLLETGGQRPTSAELRPGVIILGIKTPRDQLRARVTTRVDTMLDQGLEEEVAQLAKDYGWEAEPMKGIGYREWREYFEGKQTLDQTRERIISATMNLAKRQRTWFKRNQHIKWFDDRVKAYEFISDKLKS